MSAIKLTPAKCDIEFTVGTDLDDLFLVFTDDAGDPVDVSGYTIEAKVLRGAVVLATDFTPAVSGAGNNVLQLSMTDTETTTIGVERGLTWSLRMTSGAITKEWVAGQFVGFVQGAGRTGSAATARVFTVGEISVTFSTVAPLATILAAVATDIDDPASAISTALSDQFGTEARFAQFDIRDYGAAVDGLELTDVAITAASNVLSSTAYTFTAADVGKTIGVSGAGTVSSDYLTNANDGVLVSTIASVSSGDAVLADNAVNTVSGATCCFGTCDDDAVAAAQAAAVANGGGTVFFPAGRTVVTAGLAVENFVSWAGVHRDVSWVEVIKSVTGTADIDTSWLCIADPPSLSAPLTGATFHDFGVEARYMIRPAGYRTNVKPLNIYWVRRVIVERMNVFNTPATSVPFDTQYEGCVIAFNTIKNPGRLYKTGEFGGSGIGIGTVSNDSIESGLIIGNTIIGVGSADTDAKGNNGIFLESQYGVPADASIGYRIIGNTIIGMRKGIADNGASAALISGNTIVDCERGIALDRTFGDAFPGPNSRITDNAIINCRTRTGVSLTGVGLYVSTSSASGDFSGLKFSNNIIQGCEGRSIYLSANTGDIIGAEIVGNRITDGQLTGMYLEVGGGGQFTDLRIVNNVITNVGLSDTASDDGGIRFNSCTVVGLTIVGNRVVSPNGTAMVKVGSETITGGGTISDNQFSSANLVTPIDSSVLIWGNTSLASSKTVTGSRGGNAAVASLLTQLAALGVIVDSSS